MGANEDNLSQNKKMTIKFFKLEPLHNFIQKRAVSQILRLNEMCQSTRKKGIVTPFCSFPQSKMIKNKQAHDALWMRRALQRKNFHSCPVFALRAPLGMKMRENFKHYDVCCL